MNTTKARKGNARKAVSKRWPLGELVEEIERLAMGTPLHICDSNRGVWFWIDAEHNGETHEIMFVSQDGDPAKQLVAECRRVANLYLQVAEKAGARPGPLLVGIYRDGELVRTEELPDPRIGFVKKFNEMSAELGLSARVLSEGGGA